MKFARCISVDGCILLERHILIKSIKREQSQQSEEEDEPEEFGVRVYDKQLAHVHTIAFREVAHWFRYSTNILAVRTHGTIVDLYREQQRGLKPLETPLHQVDEQSKIYYLAGQPSTFLGIQLNSLQLLNKNLERVKQQRLTVECNEYPEPSFIPKSESFLLLTDNPNALLFLYSSVTLELLRTVRRFQQYVPVQNNLLLVLLHELPVLYNTRTDKALTIVDIPRLFQGGIAVKHDNPSEFAITSESRIMVFSGINEQPRLVLPTNDETLMGIQYWQNNNKLVALSYDTVYLFDLDQEERKRTSPEYPPNFSAM